MRRKKYSIFLKNKLQRIQSSSYKSVIVQRKLRGCGSINGKMRFFYSHGKFNARGVCTLLRPGLKCKLIAPEIKDRLGRYLILHMEIQVLPYVLVNYHAANDEQDQLCTLNKILDKLKTLTVDVDTRFIWGRDWNSILDKSLDAMGGSPSSKKGSVKLIQNLMNDFNLADVWRLRNPTYKKFSWRRTKPVTMRRLDLLVSDKMELDVSACGFYGPVRSDHSPIFIKISPLQETLEGLFFLRMWRKKWD